MGGRHHVCRLDNHEGGSPIGPHLEQPSTDQAIGGDQPRALTERRNTASWWCRASSPASWMTAMPTGTGQKRSSVASRPLQNNTELMAQRKDLQL
jgi:hypothetical protein